LTLVADSYQWRMKISLPTACKDFVTFHYGSSIIWYLRRILCCIF
jgi:hypothetical protein